MLRTLIPFDSREQKLKSALKALVIWITTSNNRSIFPMRSPGRVAQRDLTPAVTGFRGSAQ